MTPAPSMLPKIIRQLLPGPPQDAEDTRDPRLRTQKSSRRERGPRNVFFGDTNRDAAQRAAAAQGRGVTVPEERVWGWGGGTCCSPRTEHLEHRPAGLVVHDDHVADDLPAAAAAAAGGKQQQPPR